MSWKKVITDALLAVSDKKGSHELRMSDFYDYVEVNSLQDEFESNDWKATIRRTVYELLEEEVPLIRKTDRDKYVLDATTQDEFTAKIAEYSYGQSGYPITRKMASKMLLETDVLKPADFLMRPSRPNEYWYRQNVGNAMRESKARAEKFGVVFKTVDGNKTISSRFTRTEKDEAIEYKKVPRKVASTVFAWARDQRVSEQVKAVAGYSCELGCDMSEQSFKDSHGRKFTNAHHIIPMGAQGAYDVNIDVADNMVVLCSRHHDAIHYGSEEVKTDLLKLIFELKRSNGFFVEKTFKEIQKFYK